MYHQTRLAFGHVQRFGNVFGRQHRLNNVLALADGRHRAQVIVGSGALVILLEVFGRKHGVDPPVFKQHRTAIFIVHHLRMKHLRALHHIQSQGQLAVGSHAFQFQNVAAVVVATGADFIGDAVDFKQGRLAFGLRHKRAHTLQTHQAAFVGELAQRSVDGHARETKLRHQFVFRRQTLVDFPSPTVDLLQNVLFDLFV